MKKIANIFLILFTSIFFLNCEDTFLPPSLDYVSFGKSVYSAGVDPGGSATVDIPLYTANVTTSDRTVNVNVDGSGAAAGSYSIPSSVNIAGGTNEGTLTVALSDVDLGIGVNKLVITLEQGAEFYTGSSTTINYIQNCTEVTATLDITFDFWASETSWEIIDSLGGVVASGGGYSNGQTPISEIITLCGGRDYTLVFYDAYGDGMNDGATLGSYTLTIGGVEKASGGGSFGASESNSFDTN